MAVMAVMAGLSGSKEGHVDAAHARAGSPRADSDDPGPSAPGPDALLSAVGWAAAAVWRLSRPVRTGALLAFRAGDAAAREISTRITGTPAAQYPGSLRATAESLVQAVLRPVIVRVVNTALAELDVTQLVLQHVDLDAIAAKLDVVAVINRVDLDAVVARVDLDAAVARVDLDRIIDRIDIDGIVAGVDLQAVIDRIDIDGIVRTVDLDAAVARVDLDAAVARVDLDGAVARVDLDRIIDRIDIDGIVAGVDLQAVIDRIDIAAIVAQVDPDPVVARVDFDAALAHIDLIRIAQEVVDGVDLPGIIRDSTGSLASEAVHGVRIQGQQADDAVGQLVGKMFRRKGIIDGYASQ